MSLIEKTTTETLFYMAYHSFLLQDKEFKTYFEIFLDQYKNFPKTFKQFNKHDVLRIKQMQDFFKFGKHTLFEGSSGVTYESRPPKGEKCDKKHKDLCLSIYLNKNHIIEPHTGPIDEICFEHPVIYGDIDILVQSGPCVYIIEVKTDPAEHDIIGQVMKYYIGMSLKLNLKYYQEIKMITICPGYNPSAFNGLLQIGAKPLLINTEKMELSTY